MPRLTRPACAPAGASLGSERLMDGRELKAVPALKPEDAPAPGVCVKPHEGTAQVPASKLVP